VTARFEHPQGFVFRKNLIIMGSFVTVAVAQNASKNSRASTGIEKRLG
jgi:hypothetical protein